MRFTPAETLRVLWGGTLLAEHLDHGTCVTGKDLTTERKSPLMGKTTAGVSFLIAASHKNNSNINTHTHTQFSVCHLWLMKLKQKTALSKPQCQGSPRMHCIKLDNKTHERYMKI